MRDTPNSALQVLVRTQLLDRTEGLPASSVAAFVDGWVSALEVVERTELMVPGAPREFAEDVKLLVALIRQAQHSALADDE